MLYLYDFHLSPSSVLSMSLYLGSKTEQLVRTLGNALPWQITTIYFLRLDYITHQKI